jgi:hypothetical protein
MTIEAHAAGIDYPQAGPSWKPYPVRTAQVGPVVLTTTTIDDVAEHTVATGVIARIHPENTPGVFRVLLGTPEQPEYVALANVQQVEGLARGQRVTVVAEESWVRDGGDRWVVQIVPNPAR